MRAFKDFLCRPTIEYELPVFRQTLRDVFVQFKLCFLYPESNNVTGPGESWSSLALIGVTSLHSK